MILKRLLAVGLLGTSMVCAVDVSVASRGISTADWNDNSYTVTESPSPDSGSVVTTATDMAAFGVSSIDPITLTPGGQSGNIFVSASGAGGNMEYSWGGGAFPGGCSSCSSAQVIFEPLISDATTVSSFGLFFNYDPTLNGGERRTTRR